MITSRRVRHVFEGEFLVVNSYEPLIGATRRPFRDAAEAMNFIWGAVDGGGLRAIGDLYYELSVGGPREFSASEAIHALASQLATGAIRLIPIEAFEANSMLGMNLTHLQRLREFCRREQLLIVVRETNTKALQYQGRRGYTAKPVGVKAFKTAKVGGANIAGLTTKPIQTDSKGQQLSDPRTHRPLYKTPDQWSKEERDNRRELEEEGFYFDDEGRLMDKDDNPVHGDYDIQGVYQLSDDHVYMQKLARDHDKKQAGEADLVARLNREVCPERPMFQHGANDEGAGWAQADDPSKGNIEDYYTDEKGVMRPLFRRAPDAKGERFLVVHPNGETERIESIAALAAFYEERGIQWHYDNWATYLKKHGGLKSDG